MKKTIGKAVKLLVSILVINLFFIISCNQKIEERKVTLSRVKVKKEFKNMALVNAKVITITCNSNNKDCKYILLWSCKYNNLRKCPVTTLPVNTKCKVLAETDKEHKLDCNGKIGWLSSEYYNHKLK